MGRRNAQGVPINKTGVWRIHVLNKRGLVWYTASRGPSDPAPGSQLLPSLIPRICTQRHNITAHLFRSSQAFLSAQPMPLGDSLGRSNQRGSETSQASNGHPTHDLSLVCASSCSLFLCRFSDAFSSSLTQATTFAYYVLYQTPSAKALVRRYYSPPRCQTSDDLLSRSLSVIYPSPRPMLTRVLQLPRRDPLG